MAWKDWSYRRKGAVIGVLISILILVPFLESLFYRCSPIPNPAGASEPYCLTMILSVPSVVFLFLFRGYLGLVLSLFFYALIGASVGWMVEKIKTKKVSNSFQQTSLVQA